MQLTDTSIFVDFLRGYLPAIEFFHKNKSICFSAITETELLAGNKNKDNRTRKELLILLQSVKKIPVDNPLTILAGDLVRTKNMKIPDAIIAATSLLNDFELFTKNVKDFQNIQGLKLKEPY